MYAINTCVWCKKSKGFLADNNIEYEFLDVDKCSKEEREKIRSDILSRGGHLSYPAIIVDNKTLINGFQEEKLREVLKI